MKKIILTFGLFLLSTAAFAQTDSHMQAVNKLMEAMDMENQISESADRMLNLQAQAMPQMAAYKDVMSDFFHKYINWENLSDDIKKVYKESFTEQEIRDLIAFYQTETGQKLAKISPELTEKTAKISQQMVMEHQAELRRKIMKAMEASN